MFSSGLGKINGRVVNTECDW